MNYRRLYLVLGLTAFLSLARGQVPSNSALASAKTINHTWTPPRAADGHPDLQGFWSNNSATPLERPTELAGRAFLTDEEVAALQKKEHELFGGTRDAAFGDSVVLNVLANIFSLDTKTGDFRSVWTVERNWDNRTSLITDPPHGRLPAMTPEGQKRRDAAQAALSRPADGPEDRGFQERCITYGSPQLMAGYQTYYQIVQTSTAVIFLTEMIHDARAIPLDGRPHLPSAIHEWLGDSRGQWERDTLVVDTTNYKPRSFMSTSSEKLHVIERLSRTGPDSLKYEITIDDPGTWTKPWSLMIPLKRSPNPIYEYACHEGNERSLAGILAGARADEQAAARSGSGGLK